MKKTISKFALVAMTLIPIVLITGAAFLGKSSPLVDREIEDVEFLETSDNTLEVVFFGYVGCKYICPNSLFRLGDVLDDLSAQYPEAKFGGFFIDVNADTQIKRAEEYGLHFSKAIVGKNVDQIELNKLRAQFGLNIFDTNRPSDEIIHTDHFFIVQKNADTWKIEHVLANEVSEEVMSKAIESALVNKK